MVTPAQKEICSILSKNLFASDCVAAAGSDIAGQVLSEASAQAVLPLVAGEFSSCSAAAKAQIRAVIAKNMHIIYEHTELHELLTANRIPYVILKGSASASYYPNPILRTMGDVDFLVNPDDFSRAQELLESIGFVPENDYGAIHQAFRREGSVWELHRSVNGIPEGETGNLLRSYLADIMDTAAERRTEYGSIRVPDSFHHGLILLLHTASHLTGEGIGLRHLCDWAVFVNSMDDAAFSALFQEKLRACGLWQFARVLTQLSTRFLGLPEKAWAGSCSDALLAALMEDIFTGGNFGQKDADRSGQIKYISNRGEGTVDGKNTVFQLWNTIGKKAASEQISRLAVIRHYLALVASGKRKADSLRTLSAAAQRKRIYAELALFIRD